MEIGSNDRSSNDSSFGQTCATIIAITSGKGGVGKTQICANLAVKIAEMGKKVCIIDADHGLANINIVLGISSNSYNNEFSSEETHTQLYENYNPMPFILQTNLGIDLLPSKSGLDASYQNQKRPSQEQIRNMLNKLRQHYDVILIDTAAGIENNVKHYIAASDETIVVINSEPTSLTDSFGLIKRMQDISSSFEIIINRVANAHSAAKIFKRFAGAVKKYVGIKIVALGYIREDTLVSAALLSQRVLVKYSPKCMASVCINRLAERLIEKVEANPISVQSISEESFNVESEKEAISMANEEAVLSDVSLASDPSTIFESWLTQIEQLFSTEEPNSTERKQRIDKFMSQLETVCDKDEEFLASLESLVINIGINDSSTGANASKTLSSFNLSGNSFTS